MAYGIVLALVLTALLVSLRAVLDPFLLFLLLLLVSPLAGTRSHLLVAAVERYPRSPLVRGPFV